MDDFFDGRTILVTGASGGIGGAAVRRLCARGATVLAGGRNEKVLAALADETGAQPLPFELTEEDSVRRAIEGRDLYGVVNCGGWGGAIETPMEADVEVFDKVMAINARSALLVTKYASREMVRVGRGGAIVNVSSQAVSRATSPTAPPRPHWTTSRGSPLWSSASTAFASTASTRLS